MTTPLNQVQSREAISGADMEKEMPTAHHEQEESRAMSSMFADAALATGQLVLSSLRLTETDEQ
jgi:hypothetical protein